MSKPQKPETVVRNAIRETLLRIGVMVMTNAQIGRTHHGGLGCGSSDLVCCIRGRFVGLEVKTTTGVAAANQLAWGERLEENGGVYAVVRTPQEAVEVVQRVIAEARAA